MHVRGHSTCYEDLFAIVVLYTVSKETADFLDADLIKELNLA